MAKKQKSIIKKNVYGSREELDKYVGKRLNFTGNLVKILKIKKRSEFICVTANVKNITVIGDDNIYIEHLNVMFRIDEDKLTAVKKNRHSFSFSGKVIPYKHDPGLTIDRLFDRIKEDKKFIVDDYTWKTFGVTDVKLTKETMI
jgi:uncharacterized protein YrrD